jgi:CBS domain-containing protein
MESPLLISDYMSKMPVCVEAKTPLAEAEQRMFELGVRHLPVVHDRRLVGILSHRDISLANSLDKGAGKHAVERAMHPDVFTVGPGAQVHAVATQMADQRVGTAVVVEPNQPLKVLGIFTTVDALRALSDLSRPESSGPSE